MMAVANTGAVTLTKPISGNSSFLATATDRGLPRRQTTVPVFVYVLPVNRHAPRFVGDEQSFMATVPEDRPVGYVVGRVSAVDTDSGDNGVVRYYITGQGSIRTSSKISKNIENMTFLVYIEYFRYFRYFQN